MSYSVALPPSSVNHPTMPLFDFSSPRPFPNHLQVSPAWQPERRESLNGGYDVSLELGSGATGRVVLAQERRSGQNVAIKIIQKKGLPERDLIRIRREYALMKHMKHKNFVRLIEVVENPEQICIVMEHASCGDLYSRVVTSPTEKLSENEAREIFVQIAEGIQHLHRCGFVHRDIKPENILLGSKNHVYIADLGYGTIWEENTLINTACGSLYYASPEIVSPDGVYFGPEVDIWSMGVLLYVINTGRLPFLGSTTNATRELIMKGELEVPYHISAELKHLICGMIQVDPCKRFTIDQVIAHPWLKKNAGAKKSNVRRFSFGAPFKGFTFGLASNANDSETQGEAEPIEDKKQEKKVPKGKKKKTEGTKHRRNRSNSAASYLDPSSLLRPITTKPKGKKTEHSSPKKTQEHNSSPKKAEGKSRKGSAGNAKESKRQKALETIIE